MAKPTAVSPATRAIGSQLACTQPRIPACHPVRDVDLGAASTVLISGSPAGGQDNSRPMTAKERDRRLVDRAVARPAARVLAHQASRRERMWRMLAIRRLLPILAIALALTIVSSASARPTLLLIHGGGFLFGGPSLEDQAAAYAQERGWRTVS